MNELVLVEGTSTYLTSNKSQLVQVYLGCWISLLSGQMRALTGQRKEGPEQEAGGSKTHKEAQGSAEKAGWWEHEVPFHPRFPQRFPGTGPGTRL